MKFIFYLMLNKYIIGEKSVYFNGRIFIGPLKSRVVIALIFLIFPLGTLCVKRFVEILIFYKDIIRLKLSAEVSTLSLSDWLLETILFLGTLALFLICALLDPGIITKDPLGPLENGLGNDYFC